MFPELLLLAILGTNRGAHSAMATNDMNRSLFADGDPGRWSAGLRSALRRGHTLLATLAILAGMLLVPASALASPVMPNGAGDAAHEETVSEVASQNAPKPDRQYVFSVGIVDRVSSDALTLRFDDGVTETYRLNGETVIQSQNGDALRRSDLAVGEMAIVLNVENDPTAVTVVSGGSKGFHEAGPADIRGHDDPECTDCDAHVP